MGGGLAAGWRKCGSRKPKDHGSRREREWNQPDNPTVSVHRQRAITTATSVDAVKQFPLV